MRLGALPPQPSAGCSPGIFGVKRMDRWDSDAMKAIRLAWLEPQGGVYGMSVGAGPDSEDPEASLAVMDAALAALTRITGDVARENAGIVLLGEPRRCAEPGPPGGCPRTRDDASGPLPARAVKRLNDTETASWW